MSLQIKICQETDGTWSVQGPSRLLVSDLPTLSASIECARRACNADPATIELYVAGMYIVAHQERGWPKALVASQETREPPTSDRSDLGKTAVWSRLMARLRALVPPRVLKTDFVTASSRHQKLGRAPVDQSGQGIEGWFAR